MITPKEAKREIMRKKSEALSEKDPYKYISHIEERLVAHLGSDTVFPIRFYLSDDYRIFDLYTQSFIVKIFKKNGWNISYDVGRQLITLAPSTLIPKIPKPLMRAGLVLLPIIGLILGNICTDWRNPFPTSLVILILDMLTAVTVFVCACAGNVFSNVGDWICND